MMDTPHRIQIAAFRNGQILDITSPLDVFAMANKVALANGTPLPYELLLATPGGGLVSTTSGVDLCATHNLFDPALCGDTVIFAGGEGVRVLINDPHTRAMVTILFMRTERVGAIWRQSKKGGNSLRAAC